jgi:hypothetical protein
MSYGNEPTRAPDLQGDVRIPKPDPGPDASLADVMAAVVNPPTVPGVARAWRLEPAEKLAGVGQWLVHAPHGHPFWPWYVVQAIHLRPLEGQPPAHVQFPGASHEWLVVALNPEAPLPDVDRWAAPGTPPIRYLKPVDQCWQFIVASDEQAAQLCEQAVRCIVQGVSPDQDFRAWWKAAIANTAEHVRLGGHPDGMARVGE